MFSLSKELCAGISIIISLSGYVYYYYSVFKGKCRPHAFTWLIWAIIVFIAFLAQYSTNGGVGAFPTLLISLLCLGAAILGWFFGEKNIKTIDYIFLISAFFTLPLWYFTNSPLWSVVALVIIDAIGFLPTIRKSFSKPQEENIYTFTMMATSNIFTAMAMEDPNLVNLMFPVYLVIINISFVFYLFLRRRITQIEIISSV